MTQREKKASAVPGEKQRRLMVNADDLGLCPEVDRGIIRCAREGIVNSASAFAQPGLCCPTAFFPDLFAAFGRSNSNKGLAVGIHFNLSFGSPAAAPQLVASLLADCQLALKPDSVFCPEELFVELNAQYDFFLAHYGVKPSHLNFHKHLNEKNPLVNQVAIKMARRLGLPMRCRNEQARRLLRQEGIACPDFFLGDVSKEPYWDEPRLLAALDSLPSGLSELMCHPGESPGAIEGLWYLKQRGCEMDALCAPAVKKTAKSLSIVFDTI